MLLSDFQYTLPDDRIARYPLADRDQSKLLVFENGEIGHDRFDNLPAHISAGSLLVFNDTKVIPARAILTKPTGARIELLLLHPEYPTRIVSEAMAATGSCTWECMIGNKKRWKPDEVLQAGLCIEGREVVLTARWHDRDKNLVTFDWAGGYSFVDIVVAIGQIPLPPYLGREAELADTESYQTVYARQNGAVAAPTAGLHFTAPVLEALGKRGIDTGFVTLHVGAGTFQPIKTEDVRLHDMHSEQIVFTKEFVAKLARHTGPVVAVGTTSLRSLESLYWFGVKCLKQETPVFFIEKDYPYRFSEDVDIPAQAAFQAVTEYLDGIGKELLYGETRIFITPGYRFRVVEALVTNFHQPGSTLILLIAAFVGEKWRTIYQQALDNGYRFLSYGDSSFLSGTKKTAP